MTIGLLAAVAWFGAAVASEPPRVGPPPGAFLPSAVLPSPLGGNVGVGAGISSVYGGLRTDVEIEAEASPVRRVALGVRAAVPTLLPATTTWTFRAQGLAIDRDMFHLAATGLLLVQPDTPSPIPSGVQGGLGIAAEGGPDDLRADASLLVWHTFADGDEEIRILDLAEFGLTGCIRRRIHVRTGVDRARLRLDVSVASPHAWARLGGVLEPGDPRGEIWSGVSW